MQPSLPASFFIFLSPRKLPHACFRSSQLPCRAPGNRQPALCLHRFACSGHFEKWHRAMCVFHIWPRSGSVAFLIPLCCSVSGFFSRSPLSSVPPCGQPTACTHFLQCTLLQPHGVPFIHLPPDLLACSPHGTRPPQGSRSVWAAWIWSLRL